MKQFKINGLSVTDYEGNGNPLIFIHAFPLCNRMWDEQVSFFKDKYRVITYDIRGLGYSFDPENLLFTMEDLVDDLFFILDKLNIDKVNACGISIGGYILLRALLKNQNRFLSVVLADTKADGENNDSLLARSEMIAKLKKGKKEEVINELLQKLISEESLKNEKLSAFVKEIMNWMDAKGMSAVLFALMTRTDNQFLLKNITVPTQVVAGRKDLITPPFKSYYLKENIPSAHMQILDGSGHLCNMEAPEEFNKTIEEFLSKNNKKTK